MKTDPPEKAAMSPKIKSILIIDDEMNLLIGLRALLEQNGYLVTTCSNSIAGIKAAKDNAPDMIVCDVMMPAKSGLEVRNELSADPLTRDIPFLFLTARASQTDKLRGLGSGADDYITKPFDPRELLARISAVLRRHEKGRAAAEQIIASHIDRIRVEISRNISHEFRTPMTQILMALDMILRKKYSNPDDLQWFVETALSQSHRLNALIDDLVFLSIYDMGHLVLLRQKINLTTDFQDPILQRGELYTEKNLTIKFNIAPDVIVHAPRREFKQAAVHLADNGMKFANPNSAITIELAANGTGGCILTVTDSGVGIPDGLQEKVFERFYQISQGDSRQFGGLGVGLTITRAIAYSLGGEVGFLPSKRGCRISLILPPAPIDLP